MYAGLHAYNTNSTKLKPYYSSYLLFQYCALHKDSKIYPTRNISEVTLVQTAEENTSNFMANEVRRANMAKNLCR